MLDILDKEIPKYQNRNPTELAYTIFNKNEEYNDCSQLHSTINSQNMNDCLRIDGRNSTTTLSRPHLIIIFVTKDLKPAKGISEEVFTNVSQRKDTY